MLQQGVELNDLQRFLPNYVSLYLCNPVKTAAAPELGLFG